MAEQLHTYAHFSDIYVPMECTLLLSYFPLLISLIYRMFHVVQFLDEQKSVSVVPQSWYSNGATYWPSYKSDENINKAED